MEFSARLLCYSAQVGLIQEAGKFRPQRERVVAGLGQCTVRQRAGTCGLDLTPDLFQ